MLPESQWRILLLPYLQRVAKLGEDVNDVLDDAVAGMIAAGLATEDKPQDRPASIPSTFDHRYYVITEFTGEYGEVSERRVLADSLEAADLVSSEVIVTQPTCGHEGCQKHNKTEIMHTVVIDVDLPVGVLPSSTAGHFHLYIDKLMSWKSYKRLLKALNRAGVIDEGWYKMSLRRRGSHLRVPWQKKGDVKLGTSYREDWLS